MKGVILHKGNQYYTFLAPIFDAINDAQENYNWLVTECDEWSDIFAKYQCICGDGYYWISGQELTKLVRENDYQMVWGVLSGFDVKCSLEEVLKYPMPFADMNRELWTNPISMQHPLACIEIVAFDSSCTLVKSADEKLVDNVRQVFDNCDDLEMYNANETDDSAAYERWSMNHIEVQSIKTCYDYYENYWIIDGKPITAYLDEFVQAGLSPSFSEFGSLLGLLPAWNGKLIWQWENDFIWELVDSLEELNVPILVCEDDCDLSCVVIVAHIRKEGNKVCWDKIGRLDKSNRSLQKEQESGILCLEAYTDEDWEKYGDNIATENYGSPEYWKWVEENCYEEHIRRLRNYMKPYMQNEANIEWIQEVNWEFDAKDYKAVVEQYRKLKESELWRVQKMLN